MHTAGLTRDLVLLGGGHAHVHVLRSFGMDPLPGVRLTLVARDVETPYSGMLPGLIAGHFAHEDCHIDLRRLARFASARLIHAEALGIDRIGRQVLFQGRPPLRYDLLSLDIGSTPRPADIAGGSEHMVAVKPIDRFAARWQDLLERLREVPRRLRIIVVGGGAAGVELVLAMQHRTSALPMVPPHFALLTRGDLLPRHPERVREAFRRVLRSRSVALRERTEVVRAEEDALVAADGSRTGFDAVLWATQAGAAPWLAKTGLALDPHGFVAVDASLRAVNDERVFAAGDVAAVLPYPREKAGVFAVRQGPPLARNLRRALEGKPGLPFVPQRRFLSLITTGDRQAIASRGGLFAQGPWVWRLKRWIDRRWMRRYQELPAMRQPPRTTAMEPMRCGGCGAKVPAQVLERVLRRLAPAAAEEARIGLEAPDDAAVLQPPERGLLVQTVDFFRAFVGDPYLFGRIAANHALGDVYAMGAAPRTALAVATLPPMREAIVEDDLHQMLRGGLDVLETAGARLVGGHSAEGQELALGFTITGHVAAERMLRKGGLRPGDRLVLTKPLGTGTLLAAEMQGRAKAPWIEAALATMLLPAGEAAACLGRHGATACTDVTGFGLLGHLLEMLRASNLDATLDQGALPAIEGAEVTLGQGIVSTLHAANAGFLTALDGPADALLLDPQTAGGLLAGVPPERADACVTELRAAGYARATVIGSVDVRSGAEPRVRMAEADGNRTHRPW